MGRNYHRAILGAGLLLSLTATAHAGLAIQTFAFNNGAEFGAAAGSLTTGALNSGNAIQALSYDFRNGGQYVASTFALNTPITATHIRFRARAPLTTRIALRVQDESGQTLQYKIDRTNAVPDDQGWAVFTVALAAPASKWGGANNGVLTGKIVRMSLLVDRGTVAGLVGTAYFRDLEALVLTDATGALPIALQPALNIGVPTYYNGDEFPGALGNLRLAAAKTGDAVQTLSYDFTKSGRYVGSVMTLAAPAEGNYVRFRLRADAQNRIALRVTDSSNQVLQFVVDRSNAVVDASGWSTHTLRLSSPAQFWGGANNGQVQGAIKLVSIVANKPVSGSLIGTVSIRDVDVLDHAPSPVDLLASESPATFSLAAIYNNTTGQNKLTTGPATGSGDRLYTIDYDFSQSTAYLGARFQLSSMVPANTLRFLMKVPHGLQLVVRFMDETNQCFQSRLLKPIGQMDEAGFVQYAIKLNQGETFWGGANTGIPQGRIKEFHLVVNESANRELNKVYKGSIALHQLQFTTENDQLELGVDAPTLPTSRAKGTDPTKVMGVAISGDVLRDVDEAAAIGFKYARMDLNWANVERIKGVYDFNAYESRISRVLANHLTPVLILAYNNPLYVSTAVSASGHMGIGDPSDRAAFAEFARQAALHYKGRGVIFEIWNEPNGSGFWLPTPDADGYADLLASVTQAIRTVDASTTVLSGGLTDTYELSYLNRLGQRGVLNAVNGVGYHPYAQTQPDIQTMNTMARRNVLAQNGVSAGLWSTEVGASSSWYGNNDGTQDANRLTQAVMVSRNALNSWAMNDPLHVIYRLRDYGTRTTERDPNVPGYVPYSPTNREHNFGLLATDYAAKPARKAIGQLFSAASGRQYQGMITGVPSALQAMKFTGVGKETVYVAWSGMPNFQGSITVLNRCNAKLDLAGNAATSGSCVTDVVGNPVTCTPINSNTRMICPVSTDKGPIFIRISAP